MFILLEGWKDIFLISLYCCFVLHHRVDGDKRNQGIINHLY